MILAGVGLENCKTLNRSQRMCIVRKDCGVLRGGRRSCVFQMRSQEASLGCPSLIPHRCACTLGCFHRHCRCYRPITMGVYFFKGIAVGYPTSECQNGQVLMRILFVVDYSSLFSSHTRELEEGRKCREGDGERGGNCRGKKNGGKGKEKL